MYEEGYLQRSASATVAKELVYLWIWSNVYSVHEVTVTNRIFKMISQFNKLDRWPRKKRNDNFKTQEHRFTCNLDEIFDIYCHDGTQRHALQKQHGLSMTKKDYHDYNDQKHERKRKCLAVVEPLQSSGISFQKRPTNKQYLLFSQSVQCCSRDGANVSSYSGQVDSGAKALLASAPLST